MLFIHQQQAMIATQQQQQHLVPNTTTMRRRLSTLLLLATVTECIHNHETVAFQDSSILRKQHHPSISDTRLQIKTTTSPTTTTVSPFLSKPSPSPFMKSPSQQPQALLPKLILDGIMEYSRSNKNKNTKKHTSFNMDFMSPTSIVNTNFGKILPPLAFLATTPSKAMAASTTTATMVTAAAATATSMLGTAVSASAIVAPVQIETQVLNDMSHLGIDLAAFFIPSLLLLRIAAIIGRICTITADYIPDHVIVPEELVFQIVMLSIGFFGLMKSAFIPLAASMYNYNHTNTPSMKDGRAYSSIFQPAGTSWSQFKALSVCGVLEWTTVQAGDTIVTSSSSAVDIDTANAADDEYMYWLYSGDLLVENDHRQYAISSSLSSSKKSLHRGLFGEQQLLQRFGGNKSSQSKRSNASKRHQANKQDDVALKDIHRVVVTSSNATLLRINTNRLQILMDLDPTLGESIRTMIIQGLEAKLLAQVQETSNILKSYNVTSTNTLVG